MDSNSQCTDHFRNGCSNIMHEIVSGHVSMISLFALTVAVVQVTHRFVQIHFANLEIFMIFFRSSESLQHTCTTKQLEKTVKLRKLTIQSLRRKIIIFTKNLNLLCWKWKLVTTASFKK